MMGVETMEQAGISRMGILILKPQLSVHLLR
jgi:hypothetical protein